MGVPPLNHFVACAPPTRARFSDTIAAETFTLGTFIDKSTTSVPHNRATQESGCGRRIGGYHQRETNPRRDTQLTARSRQFNLGHPQPLATLPLKNSQRCWKRPHQRRSDRVLSGNPGHIPYPPAPNPPEADAHAPASSHLSLACLSYARTKDDNAQPL